MGIVNFRPLAGKVLRSIKGPKYRPPARDGDRYDIQGSWMYVDDRDSMQLTRYGIYGPGQTRLIKRLVKSDYTCLDVGANIGYFTLIMARQARRVYAFEPEPRNFDILQKNVAANSMHNVELYDFAAAETSDKATLHLCGMNRGMHRLYQSHWCNDGTVEVRTVRIDDLVQKADFIKMDIEGAELGALKGMEKLLKKGGTTLMMEFHPPSIIEYGANPRDVYDFMKSLGYSVEIPELDNDKEVSFEELERIANEKAGTNILCRHR